MIIRIQKHDNPFVQIDKRPLSDERLSWKARGLLAYLLSKPDKWEVNISDLVNRSQKDGRESVQAGLKELRELGYAELVTTREKGKLTGKSWVIRELPTDGKPVYREATDERVSRPTVLPTDGESDTSNNEYRSNNEKERETPAQPEIKKLKPTLNERTEAAKAQSPGLDREEYTVMAVMAELEEYFAAYPAMKSAIITNLKNRAKLPEIAGNGKSVFRAEVEAWVRYNVKNPVFVSDPTTRIATGANSLKSWLSRWDGYADRDKKKDTGVYQAPKNFF